MPRDVIERVEVFRNQALNASGNTIFNKEFPIGEGWRKMELRINIALTIGTGTTAISEGELRIIKGIRFRTDQNELIINSMPGRPLYRFAQILDRTAPPKDAVAAATATYRVFLPIWFVDPLMNMPIDTILNSVRYNAVQLEINMGSVADLLSVVGTATIALTVDCYLERVRGRLSPNAAPKVYPEYGMVAAPVAPDVSQEFNPERAANLWYKRFQMFAGDTTATAGLPFSGVGTDTGVWLDHTVEDDTGFPFNTILSDVLQRANKQDYQEEASVVGTRIVDFVRDGSLLSAYYSGDKSRLKLKWSNVAAIAAGQQVTAAYMGFRPLINPKAQGQFGRGSGK